MNLIWTVVNKFLAGSRVIIIVLLVFIVPKFYIAIAENSQPIPIVETEFKLGIENITPQFLYHFVDGPKPIRVGLVSNHTGVTQTGKRNIEVFLGHGIHLKKLYAPEHGFSGKTGAEKKIYNEVDTASRLPVVSLYEGNSQFKKFSPEELKDIDAFFFEMQDCGMRHYTYFPVLYKCMELAAEHGKKIVVFDRPNPLGGVMEGPLVDPGNNSFISIANYPLRHGMTMGELALYCNDKLLKKKAKLYVVPMKNYDRSKDSMPLLTALSPNIPTLDACKGYGFLGIMGEIGPFTTGVGTKKSFQFIGLPKDLNVPMSKWYALKEKLKRHGIQSKGATFYDAMQKAYVRGLNIVIEDPNGLSSFNALIEIMRHFKDSGLKYSFGPAFNKAVGIDDFKACIQGSGDYGKLASKVNVQLKKFHTQAEPYFIYKAHPTICACQA